MRYPTSAWLLGLVMVTLLAGACGGETDSSGSAVHGKDGGRDASGDGDHGDGDHGDGDHGDGDGRGDGDDKGDGDRPGDGDDSGDGDSAGDGDSGDGDHDVVVGDGDEGGDGAGIAKPCRRLRGEPLPARAALFDANQSSGDGDDDNPGRWFRRQDLCDLFSSGDTCGACHWGKDDPLGMLGEFHVTCASISEKPNLGMEAHARIWSDDPDMVMPPGSDASKLAKDSQIGILSEMLVAWEQQGKADLFFVAGDNADQMAAPEDAYALDASLGWSLSNIGSCIPSPDLPKRTDDMRAKDDLFAAVQRFEDLPKTLYETDLVSLDSEILAQHGVYSYAPTYTLFSDDASKMRYVRVPVGQPITYDPGSQDFHIPDNTRFYKTFLKPVIDEQGRTRFRKMETRLIIARRDREFTDGRPPEIRAIRASYAWDREERMATLVTDPLRSQEPFADRLCPYIVDERGNRDTNGDGVVDKKDENPVDAGNPHCGYMTADELADPTSGRVRHYAIPARTRCDECHMGSSSRSFILGFTPWHADRRAEGEGGIFGPPPTKDELEQLQRLIDYGVVAGIKPGQAKLEESQGDRKPRTEYELRAQGYMMGNCAFCHNQNGFPTRQNPILAPFKLLPDRDTGGIFEFSLERYSPRAAFVKPSGVTPIPYITPAFGQHPTEDTSIDKRFNAQQLPTVIEQSADTAGTLAQFGPDVFSNYFYKLAPWRSLIWRNTYTPYTYQEDTALFIHMPRNVPGFDVNAHRIMASWMLSIPARAKTEQDMASLANPEDPNFAWLWKAKEPQPAEEVFPDDEDYEEAKLAGEARVRAYLESVTGQHRPPNADTVAAPVLNSDVRRTEGGTVTRLTPAPLDDEELNSPRVHPALLQPENAGSRHTAHRDSVPSQAHWVVVDTTDLPGVWQPRRNNWRDLIGVEKSEYADAAFQRTLDHIREIKLTPAQETFSLSAVPLGLWAADCDQDELAKRGAQTVATLRELGWGPMRQWLEEVTLPPDGYVHTQTRGQAVFTAICQNCHGTEADSRSPLATTILELTGGDTRVANFVDGLFGPRAVPGYFADREFYTQGSDASPDDWHARYMLFMTLGGTEKTIPSAVLNLVSVSRFYGGTPVTGTSGGNVGANMLQAAQQACQKVLEPSGVINTFSVGSGGIVHDSSVQAFVPSTGHYELWESLCAFGNEPLVRVFQLGAAGSIESVPGGLYRSRDDGGNAVYPEDALVGTAYGAITKGIQSGNTFPWCVIPAFNPGADPGWVDQTPERLKSLGYPKVPWCPDELFETRYGGDPSLAKPIHRVPYDTPDEEHLNGLFTERWLRRGAMNAGLAAYYFLDRWTKGEIVPTPAFDACERSAQ